MGGSMERFAGLAWGFREHVACVVDGSGAVVAERTFGHGGAGLGSLAEWLRSHGAAAVAMETPRGPVASFLPFRGIEVRSINPRQSDRFRDRHSPSGSKDDRRDARVLANALRTDPQALRRVSAERPEEVALGSLQRRLDWLGEDRHRLESRLRSELWEFYPEFEAMATALKVGLATEWVLTLLERLPRPGSVRGVRDATLRKALGRARKVDAAGVRAALAVPAAASEARIEAGADTAAWLRRRLLDELVNAPGEAPARAVREPGAGRASRTAVRRMAARHRPRPRRRHPRHPPRQRRRPPPPAQPPGPAMPVRNRTRHPPVRKVPPRRPTRVRRPRTAQRHVPLRQGRQEPGPRPPRRLRPTPSARTPRRPRPAHRRRLHPPRRLRHPREPEALGPLHPTDRRRLTRRPSEPPDRETQITQKPNPKNLPRGRESSPPGPSLRIESAKRSTCRALVGAGLVPGLSPSVLNSTRGTRRSAAVRASGLPTRASGRAGTGQARPLRECVERTDGFDTTDTAASARPPWGRGHLALARAVRRVRGRDALAPGPSLRIKSTNDQRVVSS